MNSFRYTKFSPNLIQDVKKRILKYSMTDIMMDQLNIPKSKDYSISYIAEKKKLTLHMNGTRFAIQSISSYGL